MGRGSRPPRRSGLRYAAGGAGALSAARRRPARPRRARRLPRNSPARVATRAAAPARDVRGADRTRGRTREARGNGGRCARRGRTRNVAQYAAGVDLARFAHAARGDGRRRFDAGGARRRRSTRRRARSLARSIEAKAREMSELVSKVLDLMRFDSGEINAAARLGGGRGSRSARRSSRTPSGCASIASSSRCPRSCRWCSSTPR